MTYSKTNLVGEPVLVLEGVCQNQTGTIRGVFASDEEIRFVVELDDNGQILQKSANSFRVLREHRATGTVERDLFG